MNKTKLGQAGWCYILVNDSMPGLIQIGATTDDPIFHAKQLSDSIVIPAPFAVAYSRYVDDVNVTKSAIHTMLDEFRINEEREFFKVSLYKAVSTLDFILGATAQWEPATPFANLFASFNKSNDTNLSSKEQAKCRALEARLAAQGTE